MCDTSFNAIQISMNELLMEQLVNNSNINLLRDKNDQLIKDVKFVDEGFRTIINCRLVFEK
jgi:hypothetical protein